MKYYGISFQKERRFRKKLYICGVKAAIKRAKSRRSFELFRAKAGSNEVQTLNYDDMTTRREKSKSQKPQLNKQLEAVQAEEAIVKVNHRQEKFADFMIDVAKYVLTGVIITSLFNDVTDKTILYIVGLFIVIISLWIGLRLTNKRKDK